MLLIIKKSAFIALVTVWAVIAYYSFTMSILFSIMGMIPEEPVLMAGYFGLAIVSGGGLVLFAVRKYKRTGALV